MDLSHMESPRLDVRWSPVARRTMRAVVEPRWPVVVFEAGELPVLVAAPGPVEASRIQLMDSAQLWDAVVERF